MTSKAAYDKLVEIVEHHDRAIWKLSGQMKWVLGLISLGVMAMLGSLGVQYLQLQQTLITKHIAAQGAGIGKVTAERIADVEEEVVAVAEKTDLVAEKTDLAAEKADLAAEKAATSQKLIRENVLPNVRAVRKKVAPISPQPLPKKPAPVQQQPKRDRIWPF